jgi:hypothetical protein
MLEWYIIYHSNMNLIDNSALSMLLLEISPCDGMYDNSMSKQAVEA